MNDQLIRCEVSEVVFRVLNLRAEMILRPKCLAIAVHSNCISDVCKHEINDAGLSLECSAFVFKSLRNRHLQQPIHISPSFVDNLANRCRNLANWSLNLAISEANLASELSFSQGNIVICEVSEVIFLPSHVRTRARTRAGETVFKYRSGRKITSHNLVTSQLGFDDVRCLVTDPSSTLNQRTTVPHVASSISICPKSRLSHSSRQWANSGPRIASAKVALSSEKFTQKMGPPMKNNPYGGSGNGRDLKHSLFVGPVRLSAKEQHAA